MKIHHSSIARVLLAVLLATTFAGAARAQITLHTASRGISANTSADSFNPAQSYRADQSDSTGDVGVFSQSYTQGAVLVYSQVHATVSHQSRFTFTPNNVQLSGTLHLANSLAVQSVPEVGGAGLADVYYIISADLVLDISETVYFTLTATSSHRIELPAYSSFVQFFGGTLTPFFIGDEYGIPSGPDSGSLSGTLDPGQYRLTGYVVNDWTDHGTPVAWWDDRNVVFAFHAWATSSLHVDSAVLSGANLAASGSGGVINGTYYVVSSTDVAQPLTNWTVLATNVFDGSGNFAFNYTVNPAEPQRFFTIRLP